MVRLETLRVRMGCEPGRSRGSDLAGASSGNESVGLRTESLAGYLDGGSGLHKDTGGRIVSLRSGCRHEEGLAVANDMR